MLLDVFLFFFNAMGRNFFSFPFLCYWMYFIIIIFFFNAIGCIFFLLFNAMGRNFFFISFFMLLDDYLFIYF